MKIIIPSSQHTYKLLDSGNGRKIEQIGQNTIVRPEKNLIWRPREHSLWGKADATCNKSSKGSLHEWKTAKSFQEPWEYTYKNQLLTTVNNELSFLLKTGSSKNIGIFPEQAAHWDWFIPLIKQSPLKKPKILNLFAYTGGATLAAAAAGAYVCHVDAAQSAVSWARQNAARNGLDNAPIRWITDDCLTFMRREVKRGSEFDAIIMDPPAFGRDAKGKIFEFEHAIHDLLALSTQLLKKKPLFFLLNGYGMNYTANVLSNLLQDYFPKTTITYGEVHLAEESRKRSIFCNIFARF